MKRLVAGMLLIVLATATDASDDVVVEDWSKQAMGARGIPAGWKGQDWGSPAYDFTIASNDGKRALQTSIRRFERGR